MELNEEKDFSDDDVFIGKLTLKEVKKRIFMGIHQNNLMSSLTRCEEENINDFKLIKTNSQPNIILPKHNDGLAVQNFNSTSDPLFNRNKQDIQLEPVPVLKNEDSFLKIEKYVVDQCNSPNESKSNNLDNTLEVVDFILNHAQSRKENVIQVTSDIKQENEDDNYYFNCEMKVPDDEIVSQSVTHIEVKSQEDHDMKLLLNFGSTPPPNTPIKCEQTEYKVLLTENKKIPEGASAPNTPIGNKKKVGNLFKTPKLPQSKLNRSKAYEHIASPIATYIKNSPQVPLVKDVHPKKPLPSSSLIPKLVKNASESKMSDKENVVLPPLAYRSAKKTTVIHVNQEKLPQSNWAQTLPTSLHKPVVLKHNHRQIGRKPLVSQQDSFEDLSLHQADVSVCTQKPAFNKL